MPRPREFDPETALDAAMRVFWKKGYSATSIDDLVEATGVNRYGLYDVYESKHGLFLAALDKYRRDVITDALRELEAPDAGVEAIRTVFDRLLHRVRIGKASFGCLLCNAAEEVAPFDHEVAREVSSYQKRLAKAFAGAVSRAHKRQKMSPRHDAGQLGRYLAGLIQGASYLARSPASKRDINDYVRVGLSVLD